MSRKKKFKKKHLKETIRKIFEKQPDQKLDAKAISNTLQIKDTNIRKLVVTILYDLKDENFLDEHQRGYFILNDQYHDGKIGTLDATSSGSGYVVIEQMEQDVFIPEQYMNHALDGDEVEVKIIQHKKRKIIGQITKVVHRKKTQFIGTLDVKKKFAFLVIEQHNINIDLYIPLQKLNGGKSGDKALGRITSWPKDVDNPFGEIIENIGKPGENNVEMNAILLKNEFNPVFPSKVMEEAQNVGIALDPEEVKKRRDLRGKLTFTIDPFDAKDFDDALSFETLDNGNIEVGVHIADVSHYVRPGTEMDKEAYARGNSVYLEDRVIPMLPEQLSNVACSLRPNEDKFTFSAVFELNREGKVVQEWFGKTVTHSDHRFSYEEAQEIIEGKNHPLKKAILGLDQMAKTIRKKRMQNGALEIESEEISFLFNDDGDPIGIKKQIQKDANKLIEEFMLLANKRVALFCGKDPKKKASNIDFMYRCHDKPGIEKLNTFSVFLEKFDYHLEFANLDDVAKKINGLLSRIKGKPEYGLIQSMAIRSMAKANYQTNNIGHYGLAFDYYTHFTSPIRRYADLTVHRLLFDKLHDKKINYGNQLNEISKHISEQERKAIDAERESNKFFQVKYMEDKIGEVFEGTVSGLADFGMFVKMDENSCEGMIRMMDLPDDSYYFDNDKFQIVGRQTKYIYNFGDAVKVKVIGVNVRKKQIDLEIV